MEVYYRRGEIVRILFFYFNIKKQIIVDIFFIVCLVLLGYGNDGRSSEEVFYCFNVYVDIFNSYRIWFLV